MGFSNLVTFAIVTSGLLFTTTMMLDSINSFDNNYYSALSEITEHNNNIINTKFYIENATIVNHTISGTFSNDLRMQVYNYGSTLLDINNDFMFFVNGSYVDNKFTGDTLIYPKNEAILYMTNVYNATFSYLVINNSHLVNLPFGSHISLTNKYGLTYDSIVGWNNTPIAIINSENTVYGNRSVTFDGRLSFAGDNLYHDYFHRLWENNTGDKLLRYYWDFDNRTDANHDGNYTNDMDATGAIVSHFFKARDIDNDGIADDYGVTLTVVDPYGNWNNYTTGINVIDSTPPTLSGAFGISNDGSTAPSSIVNGESLEFDATQASIRDNVGYMDTLGHGLYFAWDFNGDGILDTNYTSVPTVNHTFPKPGQYNVILNVIDENKNHATLSQSVTIHDVTPPHAEFTMIPDTVWQKSTSPYQSNNKVYLNAEDYSWDDGGNINFSWNFGDLDATVSYEGSNNGIAVLTIPPGTTVTAGVYPIYLNVTDAGGNHNTIVHYLIIKDEELPTGDNSSVLVKSGFGFPDGSNPYSWDISNLGSGKYSGYTALSGDPATPNVINGVIGGGGYFAIFVPVYTGYFQDTSVYSNNGGTETTNLRITLSIGTTFTRSILISDGNFAVFYFNDGNGISDSGRYPVLVTVTDMSGHSIHVKGYIEVN